MTSDNLIHKPREYTRRTVRVDQDEVRAYLVRMEEIRDDFKRRRAELEEVYATAVAEASQHTGDGKPAPIYVESLAALKSRVDYMAAQFAQIDRNISADNEALRQYAAKAAADSDDTGAAVASVWVPTS